MEKLPDEILLKVFQLLECHEISQISSVCKRWHNLCSDSTLWSNVKFCNRNLHNSKLKKLIRSKLGTFTLGITVLHLGSYGLENGGSKPLPRHHLSISPDVMRLLATICPHLSELSLAYCDLGRSFAHHLPETLTELTLVSCIVPVFLPMPPHPHQQPSKFRLTQLRRLSIYWAVSVTQTFLTLLSPASGLRCLELVNCPRLKANSLSRICDQFPKLESLALPGISLLGDQASESALSDLIRRLPDLRQLNLSWLRGQSHSNSLEVDRLFRCLMQSATRLRCLACPSRLSDDVLDKMARVPSLRLVCCSSPDATSVGRLSNSLQFASLETFYKRYCSHFYQCGLEIFAVQQPLDSA